MKLSIKSSFFILLSVGLSAVLANASEKPNIIIILADDLGYNDISPTPFGAGEAHDIKTPHLEALADQGTVLTSFYVSSVCTPTRASLMTGCNPVRVGMPGVLLNDTKGLHPDEITIAEKLKEQGYVTGMVGKWHLGKPDSMLPTAQGFDRWYGNITSNNLKTDVSAYAFTQDTTLLEGITAEDLANGVKVRAPILRGQTGSKLKIVEAPGDQEQLSINFAKESVAFIRENKDKPFFLYLAFTAPHDPLYPSKEWQGSSPRGNKFGDVVQEMDWGIGQVLSELESQGISENTLVIFTSDNGAHKNWGGSNAPFLGNKGTVLEGGVRVPFIARWSGKIAAGAQNDTPSHIIDLFPTIVNLTGGSIPDDRIIDGRDIWPVLSGDPNAPVAHETIYIYRVSRQRAIRQGKWKYHAAYPQENLGERLFDLSASDLEDDGANVIQQYPELAKKLAEQLAAHSEKLRKNRRPAGVEK
ncbi:MAG: sulfatase-like hydrolase/transferase [Verrucomicrobiota bacterium]